jgi:hypothetical protein
MRRSPIRRMLTAFAVALPLAGCSAAPVLESLPESLGGMPAEAPAAPKMSYQYPAVHDMPQPRSAQPLSDADQQKMQQDLVKLREQQETRVKADEQGEQNPADAAKESPKTTAKTPAEAGSGENTGAKTSP